MAWCPHCREEYDEDNDSQPCCGGCGHPFQCGCDEFGTDDGPADDYPFDADDPSED